VHSGSTAGSTIGDAVGSISALQSVSTQLDNVLSESYKRTALDMRQQLIDVSDKVDEEFNISDMGPATEDIQAVLTKLETKKATNAAK
jgi:hypothetical protein